MSSNSKRWPTSISAALATAATALLLAGPADATAPTTESFAGSYAFSVDCADFGDFEFENVVAGEFKLLVTTFYDRQGNPSKLTARGSFTETNANSVSQKTLRVTGGSRETFDLVAGTRTVVGQVVRVTAPGGGVVVLDTGRVVFDGSGQVVFLAGLHEPLFTGLDPLVCTALAVP